MWYSGSAIDNRADTGVAAGFVMVNDPFREMLVICTMQHSLDKPLEDIPDVVVKAYTNLRAQPLINILAVKKRNPTRPRRDSAEDIAGGHLRWAAPVLYRDRLLQNGPSYPLTGTTSPQPLSWWN